MKEKNIKFRCSNAEKNTIKKRAVKSGKTVSEFCRIQALNGKIIAKPQ